MSARPAFTEALLPPATTGRRAAARLRLAIPARMMAIHGTRPCVLIDLSRTGARIALADVPLKVGESGYLVISGLEVFATAVRAARGQNGGTNGLVFEDPLADDQVLSVRRHAETYQASERDALRDQVRRWVTGEA